MEVGTVTNDINSIAKELGYQLLGVVPHVVGVSLRRREPFAPPLEIVVDIDSEQARNSVPSIFKGHDIQVRLVGAPEFVSRH